MSRQPGATPEFLMWALHWECPLRGAQDGSDPERTERQLRAVRVVGDARREDRVLDGVCMQPPLGFRIEEAMAMFGGEAAATQACGACPANALAERAGGLAGCYGLVALPEDSAPFHAAVERGLVQTGVAGTAAFPQTRPLWYGLWMKSPLQAEALVALHCGLRAAEIADPAWEQLLVAINVACDIGTPLHVKLYPPGRVAGPGWQLDPHCPCCSAPWHEAASRRCHVCDFAGHPALGKKRRARGQRPYFPLDRLLGASQAAELLLRYEARRAARELPDRLQSPPRPELPGSPRAD